MNFHWSVFENTIISWYFEFSGLKHYDEAHIWGLIEKITDLIEQSQLYRLTHDSKGYDYRSGERYFEHLRRIYTQVGEVDFLPFASVSRDASGSETQICYEDIDGIKTEWLENLSRLQQAIAKKVGKRVYNVFPFNCLSVRGPRLERKIQESRFVVCVFLTTDIFFPWILDQNSLHLTALRSFWSEDGYGAHFDNRVLAQRNAPRLNALIRDLSKLVRPYGEMSMEHENDWLATMIKPDGTIDLDFMPNNPQEPVNYWLDDDDDDW
jgi:hypothetical protein